MCDEIGGGRSVSSACRTDTVPASHYNLSPPLATSSSPMVNNQWPTFTVGSNACPRAGPWLGALRSRRSGSTAQPASHPATQCRDVQRTASVATSILEYLPNQATESNCGRGLQADRADMVRGQISRYRLTWQASRRGHHVRAAKIECSYVS